MFHLSSVKSDGRSCLGILGPTVHGFEEKSPFSFDCSYESISRIYLQLGFGVFLVKYVSKSFQDILKNIANFLDVFLKTFLVYGKFLDARVSKSTFDKERLVSTFIPRVATADESSTFISVVAVIHLVGVEFEYRLQKPRDQSSCLFPCRKSHPQTWF